jgi:hypothetical protein
MFPSARRLFVPAGTLVLVLVGGWWAGAHMQVDPLRAAQHHRLSFQSADSSARAGLSTDETRRANDVLDRQRPVRPGAPQLLYLGNSQALAIMDRHPGDLTSPQWLQVLMDRRGLSGDVRLGALPNMTTEEALVSLVAAFADRPRRADAVVAGVVLEEFRGVGSRAEVRSMAQRPQVRAAIRDLLDANRDLRAAAGALSWAVVEPPAQGPGSTWTSAVDDAVAAVASRVPLVARRDRVRSYLVVKFLAIRNRLLGISSTSARPVPDATFRSSIELLELLLRYCHDRGIPVLLYLAPIRPLEPNPNLPRDVARFRRDVPALCARYRVNCLDYVGLVPEKLWSDYDEDDGAAAGQRDFAHFTGAGHKLLAESLIDHVAALFANRRP